MRNWLPSLAVPLLWAIPAWSAPQDGPPPGGPPPLSEKQRKALDAHAPVFQLMGTVMTLDRLTQSGALPLAPAEKKALRTLLAGLAAQKTLSPAQAGAASKTLYQALSAAHRQQIVAATPRRGPGRMPPPPGGAPPEGAPPPGGPAPGGQRPGPPGGGPFEAIAQGKPFNPFAPYDPVVGRATKNLIARLGK